MVLINVIMIDISTIINAHVHAVFVIYNNISSMKVLEIVYAKGEIITYLKQE